MDKIQQRRLNRLNKEYKASPDYIAPVFSNRRMFLMVVLFGIGVAMVSYVLLTGPTEQSVPSAPTLLQQTDERP